MTDIFDTFEYEDAQSSSVGVTELPPLPDMDESGDIFDSFAEEDRKASAVRGERPPVVGTELLPGSFESTFAMMGYGKRPEDISPENLDWSSPRSPSHQRRLDILKRRNEAVIGNLRSRVEAEGGEWSEAGLNKYLEENPNAYQDAKAGIVPARPEGGYAALSSADFIPGDVEGPGQRLYDKWQAENEALAAPPETMREAIEILAAEANMEPQEYLNANPDAMKLAGYKMEGPIDWERYGQDFINWPSKIPLVGLYVDILNVEELRNAVERLSQHDEIMTSAKRDLAFSKEEYSKLLPPDFHRLPPMEQMARLTPQMEKAKLAVDNAEQVLNYIPKRHKYLAKMLSAWNNKMVELKVRGTTTGADILEGSTELAKFMVEFAASAGPALAAKKFIEKKGLKLLKHVSKKTMLGRATRTAGKVALASAAVAGGGVVHTMHPIQLANIVRQAERLKLPEGLKFLDDGGIEITKAGKADFDAYTQATLDTLIENVSERSGHILAAQLRTAFGTALGKKSLTSLAKKMAAFSRKHPSVTSMMRRTGWDGFIGEWLEEDLGKALRISMGVGDQEWSDMWPSAREAITRAVVLAMPTAFFGSISAANIAGEYRKFNKDQREFLKAAGKSKMEIASLEKSDFAVILGDMADQAVADINRSRGGEAPRIEDVPLSVRGVPTPAEAEEAVGKVREKVTPLPQVPAAAEEAPEKPEEAPSEPRTPAPTPEAVSGEKVAQAAPERVREAATATSDEYGVRFETGKPVTFTYVRNTEAAPDMGERFQQNLEPTGRYMQHAGPDAKAPTEAWETGEVTFQNPLVVPLNTTPGNIYDEGSWKAQLSEKYGKTGQALADAIRAEGHDAIVTVDLGTGATSEIVDLARPAEETPPTPAAPEVRAEEGRTEEQRREFARGVKKDREAFNESIVRRVAHQAAPEYEQEWERLYDSSPRFRETEDSLTEAEIEDIPSGDANDKAVLTAIARRTGETVEDVQSRLFHEGIRNLDQKMQTAEGTGYINQAWAEAGRDARAKMLEEASAGKPTPAPVAEPAAPEAKQPWEMRQEDYLQTKGEPKDTRLPWKKASDVVQKVTLWGISGPVDGRWQIVKLDRRGGHILHTAEGDYADSYEATAAALAKTKQSNPQTPEQVLDYIRMQTLAYDKSSLARIYKDHAKRRRLAIKKDYDVERRMRDWFYNNKEIQHWYKEAGDWLETASNMGRAIREFYEKNPDAPTHDLQQTDKSMHRELVKGAIARGDIDSHPDYPDLAKQEGAEQETAAESAQEARKRAEKHPGTVSVEIPGTSEEVDAVAQAFYRRLAAARGVKPRKVAKKSVTAGDDAWAKYQSQKTAIIVDWPRVYVPADAVELWNQAAYSAKQPDLRIVPQEAAPAVAPRARFRQEAIDTGRFSDEEIEANLALWDALAETAIREGKIQSADEIFAMLRMTTDLPRPGALKQESTAPFFLKSRRLIEAKMPNAMNATSLGAMLKKGDIKNEEIAWTGLADVIRKGGKVTKAEVLAAMDAADMRVEEVTLRGQASSAEGVEMFGPGPTKFADYTLPGGESYRELLLTLPTAPTTEQIIPDAQAKADYGAEWDRLADRHAQMSEPSEERDALEAEMDRLHRRMVKDTALRIPARRRQPAYQGGHWDQPNVVAHIRFNERTDAEGRRVLFIEEIQSDWHQEGRKKGYQGQATEADLLKGWTFEASEPNEAGRRLVNILSPITDQSRTVAIPDSTSEADAIQKAQEFVRNDLKRAADVGTVPDAPFKTTWPALAFKRMVRYAAENGFDSIAWTTGEQQAERYDLSKRIDTIDYEIEVFKEPWLSTAENRTYVTIQKGGKSLFEFSTDSDGIIKAADLDYDEQLRDKHISDVVGKELAEKIMKGEYTHKRGDKKRLSGLDLKVGGEGMKTFYDKMMPSVAKKLGKRFGARPQMMTVVTGNAPADVLERYPDNRPFQEANRPTVHSLPITDAMRESVMQGQSMFQGEKGAITFEDGQIIIHAFEAADVSTFAHETGHGFRVIAEKFFPEDLKRVEDWAGAKDGKWNRDAEEKFARAFERHLRTGKAPTKVLRRVFAKFKKWLTQIYRKLRGSPINVKISAEVQALFDKMLGGRRTMAEVAQERAIKKLRPRAKAEMAKLRESIRTWYASEVHDPVDFARERASGLYDAEAHADEQHGVEMTGTFAKPFPGEITDLLKGEAVARGKKPTPAVVRDIAAEYGLKQNVPGGMAEDYAASVGGYGEMMRRMKAVQESDTDLFDKSLDEMDEYARGTYNEPMAEAIQRYRQLDEAGAELLYDEQAEGRKLTEPVDLAEPPWPGEGAEDPMAEAVTILEQAPTDLFGREYTKPLTKGKTGELLDKGETFESGVGEVAVTEELRKEATRYLNSLPAKEKVDAQAFYLGLRKEFGEGVNDLFEDYANPMPEVREALLRAQKGGSLFGQPEQGEGEPEILFQSDESIAAKARKAANDVAILTAADMAKRGQLTFGHWEKSVTRKLAEINPDLAGAYRPTLDRVWNDMKNGRLEHLDDTQLPYGVREKMQGFFPVQKVLARRLKRAKMTKAMRTASKISRKAKAREVRTALRGQPAETVTLEVRKLLKDALGREERGARRAWLASARKLVQEHKDFAEYAAGMVREAPLTPAMTRRLMTLVTRARTASEKVRVVQAIQELAAQAHASVEIKKAGKVAKLLTKYAKQTDFEIAAEAKVLVGSLKPKTPVAAIARHLAAVSRRLKGLDRPMAEGSAGRDLLNSMAEIQEEYGDANLRDLPPSVIRQVIEGVHDVVFQEGHHNDMLAAENIATQTEARTATTKALVESHKVRPETPGWFSKALSAIRLATIHTGDSLDTTIYDLFGKDNPGQEVFFKNLVQGDRAFTRYEREKNQHFAKEMGHAEGHRQANKKHITLRLGGREVKMEGKYVASLYGVLRNPDIRATVEESGRRFKLSNRKGYTYTITAADIEAIEKATPAVLKRYVDAYFSWYNGRQAELVNAAGKKLVGRNVARKNAYPVRIDDAEIAYEPQALMREFRSRARIEHMAQFKHRKGGYKTLMIEPVDLVVERSIRHGLTYATKALPVVDALRILKHGEFKEAMHQRIPHAGTIMAGIEKDLARYQGLGDHPGIVGHTLKKGIRNIYPVALGLKPHIWLGQIASYVNAYTSMKAKHIPKTPIGLLKARREMIENVPELAMRAQANAASIYAPVDIAEVGVTATGKPWYTQIADFSIAPIRWFDTATITTIYMGAKREGAAEKGLKGKALIEYAGQRTLDIIDENQPTWSVTTASKMAVWAREHPMAKIGLSILFTGQAHKTYNAARRAWIAGKRGDISKAEAARRITLLLAVAATVLEALRQFTFFMAGVLSDWMFDDDEDFERTVAQKAEARAKQQAGELPERIARRILGAWPAARVGEGIASGKQIFSRVIEDLQGGFKDGWDAMTAKEREEAAKEGASAGKKLLKSLGWVAGMPTEGPMMYYDIAKKDAPGAVLAKDVYRVANSELDWNKAKDRKKIDHIVSVLKNAGISLEAAQKLVEVHAERRFKGQTERYEKLKARYDALPPDKKWEKEPMPPSKFKRKTIESYKERLAARWRGETFKKKAAARRPRSGSRPRPTAPGRGGR